MATFAYTRPPLYQKQSDAFFCPERYSIIEGSTKCGKTVGAMAWIVELTIGGKAGQNYWWVSPVIQQAKIPFRRIKQGLPPSVYAAHETELKITFANRAVLWFKGSDKPDTLYGEEVYGAVLDEFTRAREESWHAVRSTLTATRGPMRLVGNVKGRGNWGYKLARRAENGEPDMRYTKITAYDAIAAGVLDPAEIEDARRVLPDAVFRELYLAEPSDDGGNPFGVSAIEECIGALSDAPPVVFGVDLAKSQDWTVVVGLDAGGAVCAFERWQAPWEETMARIVRTVDGLPALVDSTGVGDPIVERLQRASGPNFEGYRFTGPSKQKLMEGLAVAIQQRQVTLPEGVLVNELESFEYEYTRTGVRYSAPEGLHDDAVMALALAVRKHPHLGRLQDGLAVFEYTKQIAAQATQPVVPRVYSLAFDRYPRREGES